MGGGRGGQKGRGWWKGLRLERGLVRGIHVTIHVALICQLMYPGILQEKQAEQQATAAAREEADEQEEEEDLPLFEVQRRANIKRNRQRMASMGLSSKKLPASLPGESFLQPFLFPLSATLTVAHDSSSGVHHPGLCRLAVCYCCLMKDCNSVKWASWPHRLYGP